MIPTNSGKYSCANGTVVTWLRRICLRLPTIPPRAQHALRTLTKMSKYCVSRKIRLGLIPTFSLNYLRLLSSQNQKFKNIDIMMIN